MVFNLEFDLEELKHICEALEYCLKNNAIMGYDKRTIKKLATRLRNSLEVGKEIKREGSN